MIEINKKITIAVLLALGSITTAQANELQNATHRMTPTYQDTVNLILSY